jgi:hypothetical protein
LSICSLIQKYWTSMCFVRMEVLLPFLYRIMVDLLSWNNCIGGMSGWPCSLGILFAWMAWLLISDKAVSSACAVDFVTVDCLLIRISMGPSPLMPIYDPVWDFLSGLLANDASMYACTPNLFSDFHVMLNPLLPLLCGWWRYLMTVCSLCRSCSVLLMTRVTMNAGAAMHSCRIMRAAYASRAANVWN